MDFEKARFNMIEQQIRPWNVLDQSVLDLLATIKREDFVSTELRDLAFTDTELPIRINGKDTGHHMMAPKMVARLLQELAVKGHESALEIGTGTGYTSALLASKAAKVISVDIDPAMTELARNNLNRAGIANVQLETADGINSVSDGTQFDVIFASGSVPVLPKSLLSHLKVGGRLAIVVGEDPVMTAQIVTRTSETDFSSVNLFETSIKALQNAPQPERFHF